MQQTNPLLPVCGSGSSGVRWGRWNHGLLILHSDMQQNVVHRLILGVVIAEKIKPISCSPLPIPFTMLLADNLALMCFGSHTRRGDGAHYFTTCGPRFRVRPGDRE